MFDSVSILFSDVVTFTEICSRITPMEVVSMLNAMYSIFDTLTERNRVYKVDYLYIVVVEDVRFPGKIRWRARIFLIDVEFLDLDFSNPFS